MYLAAFGFLAGPGSDSSAEATFLLVVVVVACDGFGGRSIRKTVALWMIEIRKTYSRIPTWAWELFLLCHLPSTSYSSTQRLHFFLYLSHLSFNFCNFCSTAAYLFGLQCCGLLLLDLILGDDRAGTTWIWAIDKAWADLCTSATTRGPHGGTLDGWGGSELL